MATQSGSNENEFWSMANSEIPSLRNQFVLVTVFGVDAVVVRARLTIYFVFFLFRIVDV